MKARNTFGTALAAAAGILALTAAPALAAAPAAHSTAVSTQAAKRVATHLSLKVSAPQVGAGAWVTLTAHLDKHGTNRTVVIYGQDWAGGKPFVVARGPVDSHGNLTVRYHDYQNHSFWAGFTGGVVYAPSTSAKASVRVSAVVTAALSGYYTSRSVGGHTVRVFHKTTNIIIKGAVSPNQGKVAFTIQYLDKGGKWVGGSAGTYRTNANGSFSVNTGSDPSVGSEFRVLAISPANARNTVGYSSWLYLTSTK